MRVSTPEVVDVAAMVLCGTVNKNISGGISLAGGRALGLSGRDDALLQCEKLWGGDDKSIDLGNVGQVITVNTDLINELLDNGISPVIAPIGMGCRGKSDESVVYNINADVAAGRIAGELKAARVLFLTDIAGVLDKEMKLLDRLSCDDIDRLIGDETITGGMIPKVSVSMELSLLFLVHLYVHKLTLIASLTVDSHPSKHYVAYLDFYKPNCTNTTMNTTTTETSLSSMYYVKEFEPVEKKDKEAISIYA